ncbi:hypothetical protein, partial [Neorhizobium alkalisoli]|uniref:hypothetical protein n=1 Tax=Neorhizobium alkalisoli TaxID=528178 RepID=UPI00197C7800
MTKKICATFLIAALTSFKLHAQVRCENLFENSSKEFQQAIIQMVDLEFNFDLYDHTAEFLDKILN